MPDLPHQVAGGLPRRRELVFGLGASALLASCAVAPPEKLVEDPGDRLWPAPPEQPRFAYETALRSLADVLEVSEEARMRHLLTGTRAPDSKVLEKPSMLAARDGRVFVADSVRRCIVVFDAPRRKVFQFGLRAPGTLAKPTAIALDRTGRVYVADATLRRVFVYDALGLHLKTIGGPAELQRPTGVAASPDGGRVYVIDRADNESEQHRVLVYDPDGKLLQEIGKRGTRDGEFNLPVQATVTADGQLHVLDAGNFRVQTFDADGVFLRSFGKVGTSLGQFARPRGLASDDEGRLYVSDGAFGNVQIFSRQGELLLAIGQGSRRDLPGRYGVISGVAVDNSGRIYIVDQLFAKVEVIRRLSEKEGQALAAQAAARA
jgi:DNA-binding beta-propeller fold protein YncE